MSLESNKEFIARMMVFINELPESKRRDYFTLLNFLDFQLTHRDNKMITAWCIELSLSLDTVNFKGNRKIRDDVQKKIENFKKSASHFVKIPRNYKRKSKQVLGSPTNEHNTKEIK
jgi:carboxypeptidase C (cathepsin A)